MCPAAKAITSRGSKAMSMPPFSGNSGAVALVEVRAQAEVKGEARLQGSIAVEQNGDMHYMADCTARINGGSGHGPVAGDVNGDGNVDVADVNIIINITLGKAHAASCSGNPDVTNDNVVDVADVNAVINAMLGKE